MDIYSDGTFKKVIYTTVYAAVAAALLYLFFKYLFAALLPFLAAWCFAAVLKKPVAFLSEKTKLPRAVFAVLFVAGLTAAVFAVTILSVSRALSEASRLLEQISEGGGSADALWSFIHGAAAKIPFFGVEYVDELREGIKSAVGDFLTGLLSKVPSLAASVASAVPGAVIFTVTLILSAVYMTADYRRIASFIVKKLPEKTASRLFGMKNRMFSGAVGLIKAYLMIFLFTFGELSVGFAILGRKYIFLPAMMIALVDFLPVLGAGAALVPMAIAGFISGDTASGIGILVLCGVISIVRQFIEPRLVGSSLGVHPLLTLASMYIGFRVFGFAGLIASPLAVSLLVASGKSEKACEAP